MGTTLKPSAPYPRLRCVAPGHYIAGPAARPTARIRYRINRWGTTEWRWSYRGLHGAAARLADARGAIDERYYLLLPPVRPAWRAR